MSRAGRPQAPDPVSARHHRLLRFSYSCLQISSGPVTAFTHSCSSANKIRKSWNSRSTHHMVEIGAVLEEERGALPSETWL